jgi:seryl-tRNA synthetase
MHNINFIRENATAFDNAMKQRGETPCSVKIIKIDEEKRNTQTILQNMLAERNKLSKEIGLLKSQKKMQIKL